MSSRVCTRCNQSKPLTEFYSGKDLCKPCLYASYQTIDWKHPTPAQQPQQPDPSPMQFVTRVEYDQLRAVAELRWQWIRNIAEALRGLSTSPIAAWLPTSLQNLPPTPP